MSFKLKPINARELRIRMDLNQSDFWSRIYVTQSGGSRYESGRNMPKCTRMMVHLVHELGIDVEKINAGNAPLIRALLSGELDQDKLQETAQQARELMSKVQALGGSADALSAHALALAGKVSNETSGASLQ